jgi:hypothetical protein
MKNISSDVEIFLWEAMKSSAEPDDDLIRKVKSKMYEGEPVMRKSTGRSLSAAAIAAAILLFAATTAFAAWHFLKPSEVAEKFENLALSAAFESDTAININASMTSGDYTFSLLAVVSGKDIADMPYYSEELLNESIYAVVAIRKSDGSPMPSPGEDEYGEALFFASPLIKGLEPWSVNAFYLNGGYSEIIIEGIMYRIVECDDVGMFADRGLYFAIADAMTFSRSTFLYNELTGEISINPDYHGASAIFDLPLDEALADREKAEQYLNRLFQTHDAGGSFDSEKENSDNSSLNPQSEANIDEEPLLLQSEN